MDQDLQAASRRLPRTKAHEAEGALEMTALAAKVAARNREEDPQREETSESRQAPPEEKGGGSQTRRKQDAQAEDQAIPRPPDGGW